MALGTIRRPGARASEGPSILRFPQTPLFQEVVDRRRRLRPRPHRRHDVVCLVGKVTEKQELPRRRRFPKAFFAITATFDPAPEQERATSPGRRRGEQHQQIGVHHGFPGAAAQKNTRSCDANSGIRSGPNVSDAAGDVPAVLSAKGTSDGVAASAAPDRWLRPGQRHAFYDPALVVSDSQALWKHKTEATNDMLAARADR